jgi:type I restriction enzyme M protein
MKDDAYVESSAPVRQLWNCCNILKDDGLSCGDYVEQLTFLLLLKMADGASERARRKPLFNKRTAARQTRLGHALGAPRG